MKNTTHLSMMMSTEVPTSEKNLHFHINQAPHWMAQPRNNRS